MSSGFHTGVNHRHAKRARRRGYALGLDPIDQNVYNDKQIELKVWVKNLFNGCVASNVDAHITTELLVGEGTEWLLAKDQSLLSCPSVTTKRGRTFCLLTLKGKQALSMHNDNKAFKIRFTGHNSSVPIESSESTPFKVVNSTVEIIQEPEERFYKDFGGQNAALVCKYQIRDRDGRTITSKRRLPKLIPKLYFEQDGTNAGPVPNIVKKDKPIFKLKNHRPDPDGPKGQFIAEWRVNDVSRSHSHKKFMLRLQPDPSNPDSFATAGAYTSPTEVMSKRKTQTSSGRSVLGKRKAPGGSIQQAAVLHCINDWGKQIMNKQRQIEQEMRANNQRIIRNQERIMHHLQINFPESNPPPMISSPEGTPPPAHPNHPGIRLPHSHAAPPLALSPGKYGTGTSIYHIQTNHPILQEQLSRTMTPGFRQMYASVPAPPFYIQQQSSAFSAVGRTGDAALAPVSPPSAGNHNPFSPAQGPHQPKMKTLPRDSSVSSILPTTETSENGFSTYSAMDLQAQLAQQGALPPSVSLPGHSPIKTEVKTPLSDFSAKTPHVTGDLSEPGDAPDLRNVQLRRCRSGAGRPMGMAEYAGGKCPRTVGVAQVKNSQLLDSVTAKTGN